MYTLNSRRPAATDRKILSMAGALILCLQVSALAVGTTSFSEGAWAKSKKEKKEKKDEKKGSWWKKVVNFMGDHDPIRKALHLKTPKEKSRDRQLASAKDKAKDKAKKLKEQLKREEKEKHEEGEGPSQPETPVAGGSGAPATTTTPPSDVVVVGPDHETGQAPYRHQFWRHSIANCSMVRPIPGPHLNPMEPSSIGGFTINGPSSEQGAPALVASDSPANTGDGSTSVTPTDSTFTGPSAEQVVTSSPATETTIVSPPAAAAPETVVTAPETIVPASTAETPFTITGPSTDS